MRSAVLWCGLMVACPGGAAWGDEQGFDTRGLALPTVKEYAAGVRRHDLDEDTRLVGWRLDDRWYFGRRKGDEDGFGFVWQRGDTQLSITTEGIGWRRQL